MRGDAPAAVKVERAAVKVERAAAPAIKVEPCVQVKREAPGAAAAGSASIPVSRPKLNSPAFRPKLNPPASCPKPNPPAGRARSAQKQRQKRADKKARRSQHFASVTQIVQKSEFLNELNAIAQQQGLVWQRNIKKDSGGIRHHRLFAEPREDLIRLSEVRKLFWFNLYKGRKFLGCLFHRKICGASIPGGDGATTSAAAGTPTALPRPPPPPPARPQPTPLPSAEQYRERMETLHENPRIFPTWEEQELCRRNRLAIRSCPFERNIFHSRNPSHLLLGYTFLPRGNAYLTRRSRELSNAMGKLWFNVLPNLTSPRLGLLIKDDILVTAKRLEGETKEYRLAVNARRYKKEVDVAGNALTKVLPKIPAKDRKNIVERGWETHSGRVGRTGMLTLEKKVQLAAVAYIRHRYTQYDALLKAGKLQGPGNGRKRLSRRFKQTNKKLARSTSWPEVVATWIAWGGDEKVIGRGRVENPPPQQRTEDVPRRDDRSNEARAAKRRKVTSSSSSSLGKENKENKTIDVIDLISDDEEPLVHKTPDKKPGIATATAAATSTSGNGDFKSKGVTRQPAAVAARVKSEEHRHQSPDEDANNNNEEEEKYHPDRRNHDSPDEDDDDNGPSSSESDADSLWEPDDGEEEEAEEGAEAEEGGRPRTRTRRDYAMAYGGGRLGWGEDEDEEEDEDGDGDGDEVVWREPGAR